MVSESGRTNLHQPSLNDEPDPSLVWSGGGKHDTALFWIWMTPVYLALAAPVLYILYALGII